MPDTILPTTEISVTAVCVDRITQSVSASPLLVDSGHYVFVTVQVTAGLSNPPVQAAWIRCLASGSGFACELRRSTASMAIGALLGPMRQDPDGAIGLVSAEATRAVFPDYVRTHYFVIEASSGSGAVSAVSCDLRQRGLRWNDGARLGLERPASVKLPSAAWAASVDLPDGTLSLRFPLFVEGDASVAVTCAVSHRSPTSRGGALIPSGPLGKHWRFSFEHDIVPCGDGYLYFDGDGFAREFRPAGVQGLSGKTVYYDTARTGAVLVDDGTGRFLLWPTLERIDFDADGRGVKVSKPLNGASSSQYQIEYSNGLPVRVYTGTKDWISVVYSSGVATISRRSGGDWSVSTVSFGTGLKEVASIAYPDGTAASIAYAASGGLSTLFFFVVSSVSYRGHVLALSRDSLSRIETAAFSRPSGLESETHFSYCGPYVVAETRPFGLQAAATRRGYYFDDSCECVAEYSLDDAGSCIDSVGYSLAEAIRAEMPAEGSSEAWEGGDADVYSGNYVSIDVENGAQIPPGSFLFMKLRSQSAWSRLSPAPYLIAQLCGSDGVLATRYAFAIGPGWVPWFLPIPDAAVGLVRSITLICPVPNCVVEADGICIRFSQSGFERAGWDDSAPGSNSPSLAMANDLRVFWQSGGQQGHSYFVDSTHRLLTASALLSNALQGDDCILLTADGAIAGESLEVSDLFGAPPQIPIRMLRAMCVREGYVWQPAESVPYWRASRSVRTFGRKSSDLSGGYVEESRTVLCLSNGQTAREDSSFLFFDPWLKEVAASNQAGERTVLYDSLGRPDELRRKAVPFSHGGPTPAPTNAVIWRRSYGADGNLASELRSQGFPHSAERYYYSSSGRLASVVANGFSPLFPSSVDYEGQELTGITWGKGAQFDQVCNRFAVDSSDAEKRVASVSVNDAGVFSFECRESILASGGLERIFSFGQSQGQRGVRWANDYSSSGSLSVDIEGLDSAPIESRVLDREGRLLQISRGGSLCVEMEYGTSGWDRDLPVTVGLGSTSITISYREDGRPSSMSEGSGCPSAEMEYGASSGDGSAYEFATLSRFQDAGPLLAESTSNGVSDISPWGYTRTDTYFAIDSTSTLKASSSFGRTGPQSSPTRSFEVGQLLFSESIEFENDSQALPSAETTIPSKSVFSARDSGGTTVYFTESYGKDAGGRVNVIVDDSRHIRCDYERDPTSGEIVSETIQLGATTRTRSYAFDAAGNPTGIVRDGVTISRSYSNGLLVSETVAGQTRTFAHDAAGRMTLTRGALVSWSGWRILGIEGRGALTYDGELLTKEQSSNCTFTLGYVLGKLRSETLSAPGFPDIRLDYFYGGDGMVSGFVFDTKPYFFRRNSFGDVVSICGPSGAVAHYAYGAFGETFVLKADGTVDTDMRSLGNVNPFRYRGMRYYRTLGVYQMGARVYDPSIMRLMTPDYPEYLDPRVRHGLNPYCYCFNDPLSYTDPTGNAPEWLYWLGGGLIIAGAIALTIATGGAAWPVLAGAGIGAASGTFFGGADFSNGFSFDWGNAAAGFFWGTAGGAVSGVVDMGVSSLLSAMGASVFSGMAIKVMVNGLTSVAFARIEAAVEGDQWTDERGWVTFLLGGFGSLFGEGVVSSIAWGIGFSVAEGGIGEIFDCFPLPPVSGPDSFERRWPCLRRYL